MSLFAVLFRTAILCCLCKTQERPCVNHSGFRIGAVFIFLLVESNPIGIRRCVRIVDLMRPRASACRKSCCISPTTRFCCRESIESDFLAANPPDSRETRQRARRNCTRSCFSFGVSLVSRTRLKNSTVSSRVKSRPSCRYGGESFMPRKGNVLIGPSALASMPLIISGL